MFQNDKSFPIFAAQQAVMMDSTPSHPLVAVFTQPYGKLGGAFMDKTKYHIGIRHEDSTLHGKLHYIAKYEGRSANAHILYLIRRNIEKFESEHGEITVDKDAPSNRLR